MDDKKIIFALDIGTRSVVGIVGALKDGCFNVLDYEQEFHEKRAMRDGQIEDIDLVARVVNSVKGKLQQRTGQTFTKVSIAAAGRALRTVPATFVYDLIPNEPITEKLVQYMEYSAIEKAQESFLSEPADIDDVGKNYYCVGYSVTDYLLDDYKIKNLEGQKGSKAVANIIAAFLPSSVLISLYAVTARCGLEVDNLTLEPIAAIHAVVPDDVRFLNIALVDIGGGTSDIAISRDGSVIAYDMVTIAGDEITESLMKHYLINFATAERIKLSMTGEANIEFKDILGNQMSITPDEAFESVTAPINALADAISQRILLINSSAPAAVFLVGGGSQIRGLCGIVAGKLGMPDNRVAVGVANTDNSLTLFSEDLYNPTFVTPIGIGIVSSLYRGCDFFAISVNGKRVMLFNHQTIKVIDALMLSGIKPSSLIGLSASNLVYMLNGETKTLKGTPGIPGEILVNGMLANIETEIKQSDEITVTLAKNGITPSLTLHEALSDFDFNTITMLEINGVQTNFHDMNALDNHKVNYMDNIVVTLSPASPNSTTLSANDSEYQESPSGLSNDSKHQESAGFLGVPQSTPTLGLSFCENTVDSNSYSCKSDLSANSDSVNEDLSHSDFSNVEINKIYSHDTLPLVTHSEKNTEAVELEPSINLQLEESPSPDLDSNVSIQVLLNGKPITLVQETAEPLILMHLLKYIDLDVAHPRGNIVLKINGIDANYADSLHENDVVIIKWSEDI